MWIFPGGQRSLPQKKMGNQKPLLCGVCELFGINPVDPAGGSSLKMSGSWAANILGSLV